MKRDVGKQTQFDILESHPAGVRGLKLKPDHDGASPSMSHPAGVRGLKPIGDRPCDLSTQVAPRRGAWIETEVGVTLRSWPWVAPRRGAWIETEVGVTLRSWPWVAPRRGAWIETCGD